MHQTANAMYIHTNECSLRPVASHHDSYTYPQPTTFISTLSFPLPPIHTCYYPIPLRIRYLKCIIIYLLIILNTQYNILNLKYI